MTIDEKIQQGNGSKSHTPSYLTLAAGWATSSILGTFFGASIANAPSLESESMYVHYVFYTTGMSLACALGGAASILAEEYKTSKKKKGK